MIIEFQGKVTTPFGTFEKKYIPDLCKKAGIKIENDDWVFISKKLPLEKEKNGKMVTEDTWLPVRAYNFEIHLLEQKNVEKALLKTTDEYLPAKRGFSSYATLMADVGQKQGKVVDIDWADIAAKVQAYDQQDFFKKK